MTALKRKSTLVVWVSSLIIGTVLTLTVFGFYVYLGWRGNNSERLYKLALYDLHGILFAKYIVVGLQSKIDTDGIFEGSPMVSGTIKNISNKKIYSMKLKIVFSDTEGRAVYVDTFYPIGLEFEHLTNIQGIAKKTKSFLLENDSISFKRRLKNLPKAVYDFLRAKQKFARSQESAKLKLTYKIEGVGIQ